MNFTDHPTPHPAVILREGFDDYRLLFQPLYGDVIGLDPVSLAVWRALDGKRTLIEVAVEVQAQFEDAPQSVVEDVCAFVADLERRGFICTKAEADLFLLEAANAGETPSRSSLHWYDSAEARADSFPCFVLHLADGSHFAIQAGDAQSAGVVAQFADLAQLKTMIPSEMNSARRFWVQSEGNPEPGNNEGAAVCILQLPELLPLPGQVGEAAGRRGGTTRQYSDAERRVQQLWRLSAFIGYKTQARGGALLHGALAVQALPNQGEPAPLGLGVLLVGRSGVGKTTASRRLAPPWYSLSDDAALVVRDAGGSYWAHPWPTWSQLLYDSPVERRDVQKAVPLKAIFILDQAGQDRATPAGGAAAVSMLMEIVQQASWRLWLGADLAALHAAQMTRFDALCALVKMVPVYLLDVSLEGAFWKEMEKVL